MVQKMVKASLIKRVLLEHILNSGVCIMVIIWPKLVSEYSNFIG